MTNNPTDKLKRCEHCYYVYDGHHAHECAAEIDEAEANMAAEQSNTSQSSLLRLHAALAKHRASGDYGVGFIDGWQAAQADIFAKLDSAELVEAHRIITDKLKAAKRNPVVLSWDDAGTIQIALAALRMYIEQGGK